MAEVSLHNIHITRLPETDRAGFVNKFFAYAHGRPPHAEDQRRPFAISDLSLTCPDGKVTAILGPSGCGKTTVLKAIAGLIPLQAGDICYDGTSIGKLSPYERRIGMVFQNYALFPHFDTKRNILLHYLFRKQEGEQRTMSNERLQRTRELMGVKLDHLMGRMPKNLSGGEKQRVAIARCITREPHIFLLDEPFSSLDQKLREQYRMSLKVLLDQYCITTVYVTHDQHEALLLADRLVIMNEGRIEQEGTAEDIYRRPKNRFVAEFLNLHTETPALSVLPAEAVQVAAPVVSVGVRPQDVRLTQAGQGMVQGSLVSLFPMPLKNLTVARVDVGDGDVFASVPGLIREDLPKRVGLELANMLCFDAADRVLEISTPVARD